MKSFNLLFSCVPFASLCFGCVSRSQYEALQSKYDASQRQAAFIQTFLDDTNQIVVKSKSDTNTAVPVVVYLCQGYILLSNSSNRELPVKVDIASPIDGSSEEFNLTIPASRFKRVPKIHFHLDYGGFNHLQDGDIITVSNPDFTSTTWTIHQVNSYGP